MAMHESSPGRQPTARLKRLSLALLLAAQSLPSFALGMDISYDMLAPNFFPAIERISTCGSWDVGGKNGHFRMLVGSIYGGDMLFVDMVTFDQGSNLPVVERGFSVREFNNDHAEVELTGLQCTPLGGNLIRISGTAETAHEPGARYRFCVLVNGATGHLTYADARSTVVFKTHCVGKVRKPAP